MELELEDANS